MEPGSDKQMTQAQREAMQARLDLELAAEVEEERRTAAQPPEDGHPERP